jgi:hypothetical protein
MEGYSGTAYRKGQPQLRPSQSLLRRGPTHRVDIGAYEHKN